MSITQILGLAIGLLTLLLSSELVRSGAARQKRPELNRIGDSEALLFPVPLSGAI